MPVNKARKKKKVVFFSMIPPGDSARLETMLGYANAAALMDYEAMIFLLLDGALVSKAQVFEKLGPKVKERIKEAIENGVLLKVCSSAAQSFGIDETNIVKGFEIEGIASFYVYAEDASIVLSWT